MDRKPASGGWRAVRIGLGPWLIAATILLFGTGVPLPVEADHEARGLLLREFSTPAGSRPHDAVFDASGRIWYAGQGDGTAGRVDPATGAVHIVRIADRSAPHGIILGPDNGMWITDGGLNAIVRVDPDTDKVDVYRLPGPAANLNTPTFDGQGILWYTGQNGYYGRLNPAVGIVEQWDAPRGRGPYGIATAPDGTVWIASLAGSYLGRVNPDATITAFDPPTPNAGVRRVWPDSKGRLWIAEYNVGQVGVYDPATDQWAEWKLPGDNARAYGVYVDHMDNVWLTNTGADTVVRFEPATETFTTIEISTPSNVAQLGGVPGQVVGAQRARNSVFTVSYAAALGEVTSSRD